jgi:hypothetical protein
MTIDEGIDDFLTMKTKGRLDKIEAIQIFNRTSRGQLLDDNRSNDGNNSTNKNDEGATCRQGQ